MNDYQATQIIDRIINALPDYSLEYQQVTSTYWHLIYHPCESLGSGLPVGSPWYIAAVRFDAGVISVEEIGKTPFKCPIDDLEKAIDVLRTVISVCIERDTKVVPDGPQETW